jgi:hypothetical protein
MTIAEMESGCELSRPFEIPRHSLEVPEAVHSGTFYPLGFPVELRSNSTEILSQAGELWSMFRKRFNRRVIRVDVHVVDGDAVECPPAPVFRIVAPLLVNIADPDNYSVVNLREFTTQVVVSRGTLRHRTYLDYFFLGSTPLGHIASWYTTPVHAGCVACNGRGVLLCGDSGAGKSSLSYACARAGWTYVSDDASMLINGEDGRMVTGDCHRVRFRPSAAALFPEVAGREITPRATGKPSIEILTSALDGLNCAPTAEVDFMVFLNRRSSGAAKLVPYSKDAAREYLRKVLYGLPETMATQYETLERLLTVKIFELQYSDLDGAVRRLERLTEASC